MPHLGTQPPVGFKTTTKQSFSGDNSTTAFTLNRASSTATDLEVFVDNIQQEPTTAYSVSGTTLTFTEAPPTGTNNVYVVNRGGDQNGTLPPQDLGTTDYIFGDDISFNSDSAKLNFGADSEITITHVADTGLNLKHTATGDDKPIILTLQTGETDIAANDVLGTINFQAPDEGTGTDAILVAAGIEAVSEGDFSSSSNATKLSFKTAASAAAAETMALSSAGNLTVAGPITPTGAITANAGVVVDNITIDGTEIDLSSGDLTVDSAGDITLDSDNGAWRFKDDGTSVFQIARDSNTSVNLFSAISDADLIFKGNDGGSTIEAMRIDMSEGGLVGIGNSSPSSQLAGAANLVIGGTSDADTGMTFVTSTSGQGLIHFSDATSGDARFDGFIGYEQNNQAMKFGTAQTERVRIASTGATSITTTGNETTLSLVSTDADASLGPVIDLHRNSSSPADDDAIGRIIFSGENDNDEKISLVQLIGLNSDVTDGTEDGRLQLFAFKDGTSRNRFDIQPTETSFNDDRVDVDMRVESANQGNQLVVDAGLDTVLIGTSSEYSGTSADLTVNKHLDVGDSSSSDNAVIAGAKSATTGTILSIQSKVSGFSTMPKINFVTSNVGGGSQTGELEFFTTLNASQTLNFKIDGNGDLKANDTSIGSLSDERLKKDIEDFTYDLEKFKKLETKSFKWINPVQHGGKSDTVYGTIAQQIESVDADFITDDLLKDTLDNNGFEETNPDYTLAKDTNGVAKVSKITGKKDAMFISVIQQLISKVETLEDEVKVLKG